MKNQKFERELKSLIYYIRKYGIQRVNMNMRDIKGNKEKQNDFVLNVHKGFYLAQQDVIVCLKKILTEQKTVKANIKKANVEKSKDEKVTLNEQLRKLEYQERVLRKIIDSIAWQILQYDLSSIRRLYHGHRLIDITDSNVESCIRACSDIENDNPLHFALINDISSFIQVGDLTLYKPGESLTFIEVKEGDVNDKVYEIINEYQENKCDRFLYLNLFSEGSKFREQFIRNVRQIKSATETICSIKTGTGLDAFTGLNITTIQEEIELDDFEEIMIDLTKQCKKKGYAISVIEGCLLIGVYYTEKFPDNVFDFWVRSLKIKTPIYDLRQSFFDPVAYPIFLHGFSDNDLIDIVSHRITIKMTIDIDKWLSSFEKDGYTYRWMTPKETARLNCKYKGRLKSFVINKSGLEIKKGDFSSILGGGIFVRMFTMFNTPSSIKKYIIETDKHVIESKRNKVNVY